MVKKIVTNIVLGLEIMVESNTIHKIGL